MKSIRKISIGPDYKNGSMHYSVGQEIYGGHRIIDIVDKGEEFDINIEKDREIKPWKSINKNMAVVVEYNLEY